MSEQVSGDDGSRRYPARHRRPPQRFGDYEVPIVHRGGIRGAIRGGVNGLGRRGCFKCGEEGHMSLECPHGRGSGSRGGQGSENRGGQGSGSHVGWGRAEMLRSAAERGGNARGFQAVGRGNPVDGQFQAPVHNMDRLQTPPPFPPVHNSSRQLSHRYTVSNDDSDCSEQANKEDVKVDAQRKRRSKRYTSNSSSSEEDDQKKIHLLQAEIDRLVLKSESKRKHKKGHKSKRKSHSKKVETESSESEGGRRRSEDSERRRDTNRKDKGKEDSVSVEQLRDAWKRELKLKGHGCLRDELSPRGRLGEFVL